jgi:arylsulfatase A-like enzyme/Tfp pilus assembly protein PilF
LSRAARHIAILVTVTLCGCLAAFGGWRFAKASAPVNGPIVLISIDSLRADRLPAYGYAGGRTPAISALAADGIVFERFYSHVPQTTPAHAALLTGRLPFETGVRDVAGFTLPGSIRTVAEVLRDRGFATGGVVSSLLLRKETGLARGFAFFDDELPAADGGAPDTWMLRDGAEAEQVAEHWLDSIGTSRAFLFLHLSEPHAPHRAPDRFADLPPYDAEVSYADEIVGALVSYLKSHQLYDRSTIILVSDHGEGLGDHGEDGHGVLVFDESLHVPLVVKLPAGEGAGRHVAAVTQQIDLVPTILDLAKAPRITGLRGRSLMPVVSGGSLPEPDVYAESLFGSYRFGWTPLTSLISGRYQLIASGDRSLLFDMEVAPSQRVDIASEHTDIVSALRTRLAEFKATSPLPEPSPVTRTDRERYEALGYVGVPGSEPAEAPAPDSLERAPFVEGYRTAVRLGWTADWPLAIDEYRRLTREEPAMADLWLHLAQLAARHERHDIALDGYRHVLTLQPNSVVGLLGAATSLVRLRRPEDAAVRAREVLELPGLDAVQKAEAHEILARVALTRDDEMTAVREAEAAQAADPSRPVVAFVDGQIALGQKRYSDAADAFEEALQSAEQSGRAPLADLRVLAAEAYVKLDRGVEAEQLLNTELAAFPANPRAKTALQALQRNAARNRSGASTQQH